MIYKTHKTILFKNRTQKYIKCFKRDILIFHEKYWLILKLKAARQLKKVGSRATKGCKSKWY